MVAALLSRLRSMPSGSLGLTGGLLSLGVTAYVFLLLAGHVLGDEEYAPLGVLWILVFLIAPGFLYPIEQEVSRAIAARRALGLGIAPVVRRASIIALVIVVALVVMTFVASPVLEDEFFNGQSMLLFALVASFISYGAAYVGRGVFAGSGQLNRYGVLIAGEGVWRLIAAIAFVLVGIEAAGPYGLLVGLGPLVALLVALAGARNVLDEGPPAPWSELTASLGNLIAGGVLAQVLVNAAPLVVKYQVDASQQALAGAFVKAVVITRIPLFLFQAIQAMMLPKLTHMATANEHGGFRRTLREICMAVALLGVLGTLGALLLGDVALKMFGSDYPLPRRDITLLAAGNALFLLAITVSQALIALKMQRHTLIGWAAGVAVQTIITVMSFDVLLKVELALMSGAATSFALMLFFVLRRLRDVDADGAELVSTLQANPVPDAY
jgi:O-antigen/teichoic acid export membrane protein